MHPGSPPAIYLFVVAALVLTALLLGVAGALPRREPAQRPRRRLVRNESASSSPLVRALDLAEASAFDLHNTLRPIVREIAAALWLRLRASPDASQAEAPSHFAGAVAAARARRP